MRFFSLLWRRGPAIAVWALAVLPMLAPARAAPDWNQHDATSQIGIDHSAWTGFLSTYLTLGADGIARVRYADVTEADRRALDSYLAHLQTIEVPQLNRDEQFAFWVNLYNAATLDLILDHYPVDSIRDIKPHPFAIGPWSMDVVSVLGAPLSLDQIEHEILRGHWDEPRIHYAVNCASIGCPNLKPTAWQGETLDQDLSAAARSYINHPRGARVVDGKLVVSKIYKWFDEDFGGTAQGILAHLKLYAAGDLAADLEPISKIDEYEYDWSLNAAQ